MSKTYKISIEVIGTKKKVPDWGLGPGILADQEVVIDDQYLDHELLCYKLYNFGKDLMEKTVKISITENE